MCLKFYSIIQEPPAWTGQDKVWRPGVITKLSQEFVHKVLITRCEGQQEEQDSSELWLTEQTHRIWAPRRNGKDQRRGQHSQAYCRQCTSNADMPSTPPHPPRNLREVENQQPHSFFFFKWTWPWHREVPGPGIESKLQLPPTSQL